MSPFPNRVVLLGLAACLSLVACGDDTDAGNATTAEPTTVRLLTHDSFLLSDGVLDQFTEQTGIEVELIQGGDAGQVVNQAILTNGNPQADVLFGIDSTFLSRALDADLFVPYEANGLAQVDEALLLDPDHRVTPIDYGDGCLNYDKAWFAEQGVPVPASLADLATPLYKDRLVVENPATSSPGLAFLLASIEAFGEDGWEAWWSDLRANGVQVTDGWDEAYNTAFSGGGASEGNRPLVVSYASSPPAEVLYADPPITESPVGVIDASCYRQIEGAGILAGTDHEPAARQLIDFLLGEEVQADVPLSMFVFPVRGDVELPELFVEHAARPVDVYEMPAADIGAHREEWIDRWTDLVLR
jgi:thiamine transport system substrate-binding protein